MTVKIDLETAVRLAEEVVAAAPKGYVYTNPQGQVADTDAYGSSTTSCDYFTPDGEGSCIVGKVILAAGVSYYAADRNTGSYAHYYLSELNSDGIIDISHDAIEFLHKVQYEQDRGTPWATALENAKKKFQHLL